MTFEPSGRPHWGSGDATIEDDYSRRTTMFALWALKHMAKCCNSEGIVVGTYFDVHSCCWFLFDL
jgi:hypothetical protein